MRKHLLFSALLCLFMSFAYAAQDANIYVLNEGFESGVVPEGWTQEFVDSQVYGEHPWVIEQASAAQNPKGAASGNYLLALRNQTAATIGYTTRLISPVMDLSIGEVFQPILVFSHAQQQRTGDFDQLKVYYRTSADTRWIRIDEDRFNKKIPRWQRDTIALQAQSATYQVMFEVTDNFGYGVVLDDIQVRPMPTCVDPNNFVTNVLTTNSAEIGWNASFDTDSFEVALSTTAITSMEEADLSALVYYGFLKDDDFSFSSTKLLKDPLERNKTYYLYVRAYCQGTISDWGGTSFRTRNISKVPYEQHFNLNYVTGILNHMNYMSQGTSILNSNGNMEYMPFVNTLTTDAAHSTNGIGERVRYSMDSTSCYVFTGARLIDTYIPAGEYVYGTTPELDVDDIRKLSVSFWGTAYTYLGSEDDPAAGGIIVGVMTNPEDFNTFVAVDTCYVKNTYMFDHFVVDLKNYTGIKDGDDVVYGKYVALASNFKDKKNIFYVDDLVVDYSTPATMPKGISYGNVDWNKLTIKVDDLGNATSWNLLLSTQLDYSGARPKNVVLEQKNITDKQVVVENDVITDSLLYIYTQGVNAGGESGWSLPVGVKMPSKIKELPYAIKFDATTLNIRSYDYVRDVRYQYKQRGSRQMFWDVILNPYLDFAKDLNVVPWYYSSGSSIALFYENEYFALPAVPNVKDVFLKFSISPYYSGESYINDVRVAVGVMTDPFDPTTFDSLAVFDGTGLASPKIMSHSYALSEYNGEGKYIAFKYVKPASGKNSGMQVFQVSMSSNSERPLPSAVEIAEAGGVVDIKWKGIAEDKYVLNITKLKGTAVTTDSYGTMGKAYVQDALAVDTAVIGTSIKLDLLAHTAYKLDLGVVYGVDTLWGVEGYYFSTTCQDIIPVPYLEDFEYYPASVQFRQYPACWIGSPWKSYTPSGSSYSHTEYYPYISSSTLAGYAHSGTQTLVLGASNTNTKDLWLALPELDKEVNTLQLSMYIKPADIYANDTIDIGLLPADSTDLSAFEHIAYLRVNGATTYKEYIARLDSYKGTSKGKRLCMVKRSAEQHLYYIDDVKVDTLSACAKIMNVEVGTVSSNGAVLSWSSATAKEWELLVSTKEYSEIQLDSIEQAIKNTEIEATVDSTVIIFWEKVTTNPYAFSSDSAKVNTTYYVYVRGLCGSGYSDWSAPSSFSTLCMPQDINTYTENFSTESNSECWTFGMQVGTIATTNLKFTNGYLYMFNTNTTNGAYAITPPMEVGDITKYQISFDAHGGTSASYLKEITVGIITNASDFTTFEKMETLKLNQVASIAATANYGFNEAYRYTVRFSDYEGDWRGNKGNRVMFISESGESQNHVYIDNVRFDTIGSVLEPLEIWATEAGMDYAVLTWDTVGTKYDVKVSSKKIDPATDTADALDSTIVGNGIRVEGLEKLTTYYVYVRTVADDGTKSTWSNVRWFSTQCPPSYSLPYKNDFSGKVVRTAAPYDGPDCWAMYYNGVAIEDYTSGSTFYSRLNASANKAGTVAGDNGLYMGSTLGSATIVPRPSVAVLPVLEGDLSKAMIEFDWRSSVTTNTESAPNIRYLAYGIADYAAPYDSVMATVQWLDTLNTGGNIGTWIHEMLPLSKYTGTGKHIVLMNLRGNSAAASTVAYIYLDNLQVVETPEVFAPATIECGKTFGSTAELTWTQTIGDYNEWQVVAVKVGDSIPENPTVQTFKETKGTMTGLEGATDYEFYVRAVSGEKVSSWVATPAKGTTLTLVEVKDAFWNFDDKEHTYQHGTTATYFTEKGWISGMAFGNYSQSNVPYNYKNTINSSSKKRTSWYSLSGDTCLRFYSSGSYAGYIVMPQINCNLDSMQLRFMANAMYANEATGAMTLTYAKGSYAHSIKVGYMTDPYDYSTFKEITTYTYPTVTESSLKIDDDSTGNRFYKEVIVPLYGVGEGKYIVFSTDFGSVSNQFYIDDVSVEKETGCAVPVQVQLSDLTFNKVTRSFDATITWGSAKKSWNVKLYNSSSDLLEIEKNGVSEMIYKYEGLAEQTTYKFSVQANCDEGATSDWVEIEFKTPCAPITNADASWNFVDDLYQYGSSASYLIPACSNVGNATSTSQSNIPYAVKNTTGAAAKAYSRGDSIEGRAMVFYTTKTAYNAWWALPEMDFELDSMTLHFWGRAAQFNGSRATTASNKNKLGAVNSAYSRTLIVGVMTDATDFSTFTPIDTITYEKIWTAVANVFTTNDALGNDYWQEYALPLAKYAGKGRVAFVAPNPANFSTATTPTSYFYIDDVEIVKGSFCTAASNVRLTNLTSRTATIAWDLQEGSNDSVSVALYLALSNGQPTDSVVEIVTNKIPSHEYTFTNLMPGRDYYYSVKHICSEEEESSWSEPKMFTCDYEAPFFLQDFSASRTYPVDWSRYGTETTISGSSSVNQSTVDYAYSGGTSSLTKISETATTAAAWRRSSNQRMYTIFVSNKGTAAKHSAGWLVTPRIALMDVKPQSNLMLSFELSMFASDQVNAPAPLHEKDRFMVLVSLDGETWKQEDSWSWTTDGTGEYDFNLVQNEQKTWYIDLTKYLGKSVSIAFYIETYCEGNSGTGNYIYLDNVQLNTFDRSENVAKVCRWEDFDGYGFSIDADQLPAGVNYFEKFVAGNSKKSDQLSTLTVTVTNDTINSLGIVNLCEGERYEQNNFSFEALNSGTFKQKLQNAQGCDSIVTLTVNVTPRQYNTVEATICQGAFYEFNGTKYYTSTSITDTITSTVTGCDSIVTLYLTVNDILRGEQELVYLCPDDTYNFTEKYQNLTEEGIYVDTITNALGCDSIASVELKKAYPQHLDIRAAICQGEVYQEGFFNLREGGVFTTEPGYLFTAEGCDSIVTLHLLVANMDDKVVYDSIAVENLPYVLNGVEIYPVGTEQGVKTSTLNLNCGEVTLVVTIGDATGLNNLYVNSLALAPNPAKVGEEVQVLASFTAADFNDMVVEVYTSTGVLVNRFSPKAGPVVVPGLPEAGLYMVSIKTGDKIYQSKLLVK